MLRNKCSDRNIEESNVRLAGRIKQFRARQFGCLLAILTAVLFIGSRLEAQSYRGTINGTVTDKTGAVVVGAHVQIINEDTKFVTVVVTNGSGLFSAPFLTPGTYDVKVDAQGFGPAEQDRAVLVAADTKEVDFALSPASAGVTVDVTENNQMLQTASATIGETISPNEVENTPYMQDNPMMLATRVAGVYSNFTAGNETSNWRPVGGGMSGTTFSGVQNLQLDEVDGITDTPPEGVPAKSGYSGWIPPPGAIQEMHVTTAAYDAQYGQTAGGVLSVVTKSGTQQYHGHAGFYFGDTIFTANTFNRNANLANGVWSPLPRTTNNWREPSFSVTGPAKIPGVRSGNDKTYFMVAYEHSTYNIPVTASIGSVPTLRERVGDFSELLSSNYANCPAFGGTVTTACQGVIYDPTTTNLSTHARTSFVQENMAKGATPQAAGCAAGTATFNCIPTARITNPGGGAHPVGQNLINYFPLPTNTGTSGGYLNNYQPPNGISDAEYYYSLAVRVDHEFNEKNKLSATYLRSKILIDQPNFGFPYDSNGFSAGTGFAGIRIFHGGALEYTRIISPTTVLSLRTGGLSAPFEQPRPGATFPLSNLGITGATATFPALGFPGTSESGPAGGYTGLQSGASVYDYSGVINNAVTLSKSFQKQTVKVGVEYNKYRDSVQSTKSNITSSNFVFNTQLTNANATNTAASNGGDGIASMLLGYTSPGAVATIISPPTYDWHYLAGFIQDDWRLTKKLTISAGFRWDYESPVTERHNYLNAGFDLSSINPMNQGSACSAGTCPPPTTGAPQGYHGGLLFVSAGQPQPFATEIVDRWQPRVGVAYHIWENTVLRGGYAIFMAPNPTIGNNLGFSSTTTYSAASTDVPNNCTAAQGGDAFGYCNLTHPFPNGFITPTGSSLGLSTSVGQPISYTDNQRAYPKANVWSVDIEQQLPWHMLLDVAYHGSLVNGLGITKNWNALPACYYNTYNSSGQFVTGGCPNAGNSQALTAAVANPMAGYLPASSSLNNPTIQQQNLYLPYPEFGAINDVITKVPGSGQRVGEVLYNALLATFDKRISHGLEFRVNATVAHVEDRLYLVNATDSVTNPTHTDDNQPNRFLDIIIMYSLPKVSVQNKFLSGVVNGWGFNEAIHMQDQGFILSPAGAFSTGISPVTHHKSLSHWFNSCYIPVITQVSNTNPTPVFGQPTNCQFGEQPAWIQQPSGTLNQFNGNQGMRGVRAQSIPYAQANLIKRFPIHERMKGEFRVDVFNPFNWDLLGTGANNSLTSSTFGSNTFPLTQGNEPRIIRFGAKVSF